MNSAMWRETGPRKDTFVLIELPLNLDLDLLADAFVNFAETLFEETGADTSAAIFSWTEVGADEFDQTCGDLADAPDQSFLQAVWTEGRLAIIASHEPLNDAQRIKLFDDLVASHDEAEAAAKGWRIVRPSAPDLSLADRRKPVLATPEQLAHVNLILLQENGQHPFVAMPPIFLTSPNVAAFEATFEVLQERHEILHMSFAQSADQTYLRLHDDRHPQFSTQRTYRKDLTVEQLAARTELKLSKRLSLSAPLWTACLVQRGPKAAVVCVLSETIADTKTAILLRAEVLELYEWFKTNSAGEPPQHGRKPQFLDFAAAERNPEPALNWWSKHPLDAALQNADTVSVCAPVISWNQDVPSTLGTRFGEATETVLFAIFLRCLQRSGGQSPDWALARTCSLRPLQGADMLGQFSIDLPIWLGDVLPDATTEAISARMQATREHGVVSHDALMRAKPDQIPRRIPYLFDFTPLRPASNTVALPQDVTCRVWQDGPAFKTQWCVRCDHPLSRQEDTLRNLFEQEIRTVLDT